MAELSGDQALYWDSIDVDAERLTCAADGVTINQAKAIQVATKPLLIELYGLEECHRFALLRYVGCGDGDDWLYYRCGGCPVVMDVYHPSLLLFLPGRYKLQMIDCCPKDPIDSLVLVRTPLTNEQATLYQQQQCCCPNTGDANGCG